MKTSTPMTLLKDKFKEFNYLIDIKPFELNKSEPKYVPYFVNLPDDRCQTKGVSSDFIRVYNLNQKKSFAFAFNNLDGKNGTITVTFKETTSKTKSDLFIDRTFDFETFKTNFKVLIQTLKILNKNNILNINTIEDSIFETFNLKNSKEEKELLVQDTLKELKKELKPYRTKVLTTIRKNKKCNDELMILKNDLTKQKNQLSKELGIDELEKLLKEKKEILNKKISSLTKKVSNKESKKSAFRYSELKTKNNYDSKLNSLIKKYPKHLQKEFKDNLLFDK
jgi:hypothetical protein